MLPVQLLKPRFLEKIWGSHHLSPWFGDDEEHKIGEVWLEGPAGEPLPLLIKFLFTTEALSVQVHPEDDYAQAHHQSVGKTEMWHILRSEPGGRIAIGLQDPLTKEELREASLSGAIEQHLNWVEVHPGDTFFIPAGTIHAIGAGVALCEVQQQSDITYRLYDYGRPRELHLDHGVAVSDVRRFEPVPQPAGCLAECRYFRAERFTITHERLLERNWTSWLICLEGKGKIGGMPYAPGSGWQRCGPALIEPAISSTFLETWVPVAGL